MTMLAACLLGMAGSASASMIAYNFDDGTLQGWTSEMDGGPSETFVVSSSTANNRPTAQAGTHKIHPENFDNRDTMTSTLLLRSPEFTLDGTGDISAYLTGGNAGTAPTDTDTLNGFQGIGLRRVSDNQYVLSAGRAANGAGWDQVTINQAALDPYVGTGAYTLDLIDDASGGWGWVAMDTVSIAGVAAIPEPSSAALLGLGGLALILRRRK